MPQGLQEAGQCLTNGPVVLHDADVGGESAIGRLLHVVGERELDHEACASAGHLFGPDRSTVGFDDAPANGQAQPDTPGFPRAEGGKKFILILFGQSHSRVFNGKPHHSGTGSGGHPDPATILLDLFQGLKGIEKEVEHDLLDFDPAGQNRRESGIQIQRNNYLPEPDFPVAKVHGFLDHRIQVYCLTHYLAAGHQSVQASNDLGRTLVVPDDQVEHLAGAGNPRRIGVKVPTGDLGVGHNGGQGLVQFMGDGGDEFAQDIGPADPVEVLPGLIEFALDLDLGRDIDADGEQPVWGIIGGTQSFPFLLLL